MIVRGWRVKRSIVAEHRTLWWMSRALVFVVAFGLPLVVASENRALWFAWTVALLVLLGLFVRWVSLRKLADQEDGLR